MQNFLRYVPLKRRAIENKENRIRAKFEKWNVEILPYLYECRTEPGKSLLGESSWFEQQCEPVTDLSLDLGRSSTQSHCCDTC